MSGSLQPLPVICVVLVGCAHQVFPPPLLKGVDHEFDFARWRMVPGHIQPTKIQLGGRIIETQVSDKTVLIIAAELPIVHHPAYGPKQGKSKGEFVITHQGKIEQKFLHPGNRLMVVGKTRGTKLVGVDDVPRSLPSLDAHCIHIWKTGHVDIADFASSGAGYGVLEEETFCRAGIN